MEPNSLPPIPDQRYMRVAFDLEFEVTDRFELMAAAEGPTESADGLDVATYNHLVFVAWNAISRALQDGVPGANYRGGNAVMRSLADDGSHWVPTTIGSIRARLDDGRLSDEV